MNNHKKYIVGLLVVIAISGCVDILDISPKDRIAAEDLLSNPDGVRIYMANLYSQLPVEDFTYFRNGFNINSSDPNNGGYIASMVTDEAVHSAWNDGIRSGDFTWWEPGYKLIRDVNILFNEIPQLNILEEERDYLIGEASFIRGYAYYALAKRYGGVPIIDVLQHYEGSIEDLMIPRSTEKETWDFVLSELTKAAENLPSQWTTDHRRATKWAALGLKSRAALHAASVAKYNNKLNLTGTAVDNGLVGLDTNMANEYYQQVIDASEQIIIGGQHSLYKDNPANIEESIENIQRMFENPNIAPDEAIFIKGYARRGTNTGHNYDIWYQPNQLANGWPHPGRLNPALDLIDLYESYDNPGQFIPVQTTITSNVNDYSGFDINEDYIRYSDPYEIFTNRDARFHASIIAPGSIWKGEEIIIQAGLVTPDGETMMLTEGHIEYNGNIFYTYGAPNRNQYSGFDTFGENYTRTGFLIKKFLDEQNAVTPSWNQSVTDYMDIRYAEILLNYAEAVIESGMGDFNLARQALNDIRKRAGHTVEVDLTLENILRERRVELAFENRRMWDLIRRREFEDEFNNRRMHALLPLLDLRVEPAQYIFVRTYIPNFDPRNFDAVSYYRPIPGISGNELIQNPNY